MGLLGACLDRFLERLVDVLDVDDQVHRRVAQLLGVDEVHLRRRVGHHDHRVADGDLGVADAPAGCRDPEALHGAEDLLVELDGVTGAVDGQVGGDPGVVVGDGLDLRHGGILSRCRIGTGILLHKTGHLLTG